MGIDIIDLKAGNFAIVLNKSGFSQNHSKRYETDCSKRSVLTKIPGLSKWRFSSRKEFNING